MARSPSRPLAVLAIISLLLLGSSSAARLLRGEDQRGNGNPKSNDQNTDDGKAEDTQAAPGNSGSSSSTSASINSPGRVGHTGHKFHFEQDGGARKYLQQLEVDEPGKLDRIMQMSHFKEGTDKLAQMLDEDADMGVDLDNDALMFVCEALAVKQAASAEITTGVMPSDTDPLASQAFNLSSRPAASRKVLLDFTGGVVTGTGECSSPIRRHASHWLLVLSPQHGADGSILLLPACHFCRSLLAIQRR